MTSYVHTTLQLQRAYFDRNPDQYSVEENNGFIEKELQSIIDKYVPTKMSKSRKSYPWIDHTIKSLMRKRDKLFVQANKTRSPQDWNRFKNIRQHVKNTVREKHSEYIKNLIDVDLKENPKPFWNYIKSLRKDNQGIPTLRTPTGSPAISKESKANVLVNQFSSVFTK